MPAANRKTYPACFWAKVSMPSPDECWIWTAGKNTSGYGTFKLDGLQPVAHRLAYELTKGPIPEGLTLDHLCRVRACVNPAHLEAIPMKTNVLRGIGPTAENARKTHCKRGHEYTSENTMHMHCRTERICKICESARQVRRRAAKRRLLELQ
jgi:HNH endonuclease